jgi:hypothetical protein
MKKLVLAGLLLTMGLFSCKNEEKPKDPFFPTLAFIKSQVAHVDTSLFQIVQVNILDSAHSDTIFLPREKFREAAKEFLELPDLAQKEFSKRYTEEKLYDTMIKRALLVYQAEKPDEEIIRRQEVVLTPDMYGGNGTLNTIIFDVAMISKDSSVQKRMLWQADRGFQVTTIRQKPGQEESIITKKVSWNGMDGL